MLKSSLEKKKKKKKQKPLKFKSMTVHGDVLVTMYTLYDHPANVSSSKHALSNGLTGLKVAGAMKQKGQKKHIQSVGIKYYLFILVLSLALNCFT